MALSSAERQARYRAKHAEKIAAYRDANKARQDAEYRERHKEKIAIRAKKWNADNEEQAKANKQRWYEEHKAEVVARAKAWNKQNPWYRESVNAKVCAKRRMSQIKQMPSWANDFFISEIYDLAKRRTATTGYEWQVDHIVPLHSSVVCGLHTEQNLQVIPATINSMKSNRRWPNMPEGV